MDAPDVELAEAIVSDMNDSARDWTQAFQAERTWSPVWIGKEQLKDLQCLVCPWPIVDVMTESRDAVYSVYSIDFGFAKRLEDKTQTEVDSLRLLVDAAMKRYVKTNFNVTDVGNFVALRRTDEYMTFDPTRLSRVQDGNTLNYTGDFLSVFRVPYRLIEVL